MERLEHTFIPNDKFDKLEHSWQPDQDPVVSPKISLSESLRIVVSTESPSRLEHSWLPGTGPATMAANLVAPTTSADGLGTGWVWPTNSGYTFPRRLEHDFRYPGMSPDGEPAF